ncbi:PepSY domain-containing protein [Acetobacter malorum]|uniref:PepSY-associated TM helix domain-containing protein n=1 Tax=Acetobacter malorum TaxID=178901 RepID=UPI00211B0102|nr:PepSY-associated TM helix domain-containing protein [Acetobacter malorum]
MKSAAVIFLAYAGAAFLGFLTAYCLPLSPVNAVLAGIFVALVGWPVLAMAGFSRVRTGFRAAMTQVHDMAGIFTGWLIYIITLSGTLSVFRPEISLWARPELRAGAVDPVKATEAAIGWLSRHAPQSSAWYITPARERAPFSWAAWDQNGAFLQRALDPVTGSPDTIRDTLGGDFFYRFHFELQLPYPWGRLLAAIAALALVFVLLTGIVAHRRIFLDFFTFRPKKGQRSWLDAHNLAGVAALPFHLTIALTGAVTLGTLLMPWAGLAHYRDASAFEAALAPSLSAPAPTGRASTLAPIGPVLAEAAERLKTEGLNQVYVYNPSDAAATIVIMGDNNDRIAFGTHVLRFDGKTGKLLADTHEERPVVTAFAVLYGLHVAHFAPLATRWLYFGSGILLLIVTGSGLRLWIRRRLRRGDSVRLVLLDRINAGMVAGTPVAFAAFFLANRLLPVALAERATREIQIVFAVWFLLLLLAVVLPARTSWRLLVGLGVGVSGGIVLLSAPWADSVERAVSLVALCLAGCCVAALGSMKADHDGM